MAVTALVLIAGTLAVVGIARSGGSPAKPQFTLVTPYPAAVAADAELADRTGGTAPAAGVADRDSLGGQDRRRHRCGSPASRPRCH